MDEHTYKSVRRRNFIRVSFLTYIILGISIAVVIFCMLSIALPWGYTSSGGWELDWGFNGFPPLATLALVFINLAFFIDCSLTEKCLIPFLDFVVGIVCLHSLHGTQLSYNRAIIKPGFHLAYVGAGLLVLVGILCIVEIIAFPRLKAAGKARLVRFSRFQERENGPERTTDVSTKVESAGKATGLRVFEDRQFLEKPVTAVIVVIAMALAFFFFLYLFYLVGLKPLRDSENERPAGSSEGMLHSEQYHFQVEVPKGWCWEKRDHLLDHPDKKAAGTLVAYCLERFDDNDKEPFLVGYNFIEIDVCDRVPYTNRLISSYTSHRELYEELVVALRANTLRDWFGGTPNYSEVNGRDILIMVYQTASVTKDSYVDVYMVNSPFLYHIEFHLAWDPDKDQDVFTELLENFEFI